MLTLYHAGNSVCSIKARLGLEEAGLEWQGIELDLGKGDQFAAEYLTLNPNGVVPTLVDDGKVLVESSVIIDYAASIGKTPDLIPADPYAAARARLWGMRGISLHAAANTVSFASYGRLPMLAKSTEEREAHYARMPDPEAAAKRRDLVDNGANSPRVAQALKVLRKMATDIEAELETGPWLAGAHFGLGDIAVAAYVYRADCVGLGTLWKDCPRMNRWWAALQERPAWERSIGPWLNPDLIAKMRGEGEKVYATIAA